LFSAQARKPGMRHFVMPPLFQPELNNPEVLLPPMVARR
jgi:hypothetical protein